jgi:hypothetical protein
MDFAEASGDVEAADIVIMNRVVCCYPDMPSLTAAAAGHAREALVMSYPKDRWWMRAALRIGNLVLRVTRRQFQVFLHRLELILATAEGYGLQTAINERGVLWQVAALRRGG